MVSPGGASAPASAVPPVSMPAGTPGRISLTATQLLINQRIAQAAVRRVNILVAMLEHGLSGQSFQDGSIGASALEH
jgi:hypothetical protein